MKILKKAGILAMACILGLSSLAACGNKDEVSSDPNTLNVRLFKGGYGTSWVYELASAFEELYAEENYKINIINPSSDMRGNVAIQEMALGYKDKGIDLYITGDIRPDKVGELGDYGVLVEEISDLYEMTPVSFDGTEENVKIKDKIYSQLFQNMADSNGKIYAYPYMNCAAGVVVNTKKLKKYGFTEFPKTTDEWFDMIDNIYCGCNGQENSEKTKVFPITYVPGNTNGYTLSMVSLLMLQYDEDQFNEFASMQKKDENGNYVDMKDDGYEVYNNECVLEMLNVCYRLFDNKIASYGTASQGLDQAQAQIMKDGGAVFMCNGDWMLNEVALNYKNYLNDIEYMNYPVVSALGTKLWGDKYSAEDCEKILSYVIGKVDENVAVDDIVVNVKSDLGKDVTAEEVQDVKRARKSYSDRSSEHQIYIVKGSTKKDIAYKFLRMLASEDCTKIISDNANANSAFSKKENTYNKYKFVQQASKIVNAEDAIPLIYATNRGFKKELNISLYLPSITHVTSHIATKTLTIYDNGEKKEGADIKIYRDAAIELQKSEYENAKNNWKNWTKNVG